jgi:hypothetical protein
MPLVGLLHRTIAVSGLWSLETFAPYRPSSETLTEWDCCAPGRVGVEMPGPILENLW